MTEHNENKADAPTGDVQRQRPENLTEEQESLAFDVREYLYDVIDPELGINVVDLGLVYDVWIEDREGENVAMVNMTLTSPACPLTDVIEDQVQAALVGNGIVDHVDLEWVWLPPWGYHLITEDGREQLRSLGFAV